MQCLAERNCIFDSSWWTMWFSDVVLLWTSQMVLLKFHYVPDYTSSLQCFDAVAWAAGRAFPVKTLEWWGVVWSAVQTCMWPSWCRLTRVVLDKGPLNSCVCACVTWVVCRGCTSSILSLLYVVQKISPVLILLVERVWKRAVQKKTKLGRMRLHIRQVVCKASCFLCSQHFSGFAL